MRVLEARGWGSVSLAVYLDAVLDDADYDIVADKSASAHQRLGLFADLGAGGDRRAKSGKQVRRLLLATSLPQRWGTAWSSCGATYRSMSPVESWGIPSFSSILGPCVPLPAPLQASRSRQRLVQGERERERERERVLVPVWLDAGRGAGQRAAGMRVRGSSRWPEEDHDLARPELRELRLDLGPGVWLEERECGRADDSSQRGGHLRVLREIACIQRRRQKRRREGGEDAYRIRRRMMYTAPTTRERRARPTRRNTTHIVRTRSATPTRSQPSSRRQSPRRRIGHGEICDGEWRRTSSVMMRARCRARAAASNVSSEDGRARSTCPAVGGCDGSWIRWIG
eukprot:COSAG03_NODE_4855_length_1412_cov_0.900228_1_plen_340_part_10